MSTETFYFTSPPPSGALGHDVDGNEALVQDHHQLLQQQQDTPPTQEMQTSQRDDDLRVVDLSVERGLLHVKGVFPDYSVEYVDVDPRFSTVGDLKRALCEKRQSLKDLGFAHSAARVMFNGQLVEDDWLVLDCGLGLDGAIYIVKALATPALPPLFGSRAPVDPRLPVSSIASSYAHNQQPPQWLQRAPASTEDEAEAAMVVEFNQSMALSTAVATQGAQFSKHVRPEESIFAEMLSDFYQHLEHVQDPDAYSERLLRGYIDVLQSRLETLDTVLQNSNRLMPGAQRQRLVAQARELRDERNTWRLLYELRCICRPTDDEMEMTDDMEDLRFDMVEADAVRLLESRNENYKIQRAVRTWLENIAMEKTVEISEKRYQTPAGSRTLKMLQKGMMDRSGVRLDPDAVTRNGDRHIVEDDAEDETELLKGVWSFIRAGNLQEAVELCVRMGQPWRAASLSGGSYVGAIESEEESAMERWGNPMRALWKTTCWKAAEQKPVQLSKRNSRIARQYEEIIYGVLGGNIQVVAQSPLCQSWEDHCWAYLHAMTEQQIDEVLHKLLKVKLQSTQLLVGNNAHYLRLYQALLDQTSTSSGMK
ncbi:hypothetical protein PINS_up001644 [Pythium insidiosum]|nr:hypothetical protein PINS_up001644 [Pythium insidiosum]